MSVDTYFDKEIRAISAESKAIAHNAAEDLRKEVERDIRRNFRNTSAAFANGIKIYEFEDATFVRLSPILSSHAQTETLSGSPNLWILLPDGVRLGFKRIGTGGFNWDTLKRRYGSRLAFVSVHDGHVLLYRSSSGVFPIYKIQPQVQTKQRIHFWEKAEKIGEKYGFEDNRVK